MATEALIDRINSGCQRYPNAYCSEIDRIATEAQRLAEEEQRSGRADGVCYSACQTSYGCDWEWGDGTTTRDASGRIVLDRDEEPTARVYDCDGNTLYRVS